MFVPVVFGSIKHYCVGVLIGIEVIGNTFVSAALLFFLLTVRAAYKFVLDYFIVVLDGIETQICDIFGFAVDRVAGGGYICYFCYRTRLIRPDRKILKILLIIICADNYL